MGNKFVRKRDAVADSGAATEEKNADDSADAQPAAPADSDTTTEPEKVDVVLEEPVTPVVRLPAEACISECKVAEAAPTSFSDAEPEALKTETEVPVQPKPLVSNTESPQTGPVPEPKPDAEVQLEPTPEPVPQSEQPVPEPEPKPVAEVQLEPALEPVPQPDQPVPEPEPKPVAEVQLEPEQPVPEPEPKPVAEVQLEPVPEYVPQPEKPIPELKPVAEAQLDLGPATEPVPQSEQHVPEATESAPQPEQTVPEPKPVAEAQLDLESAPGPVSLEQQTLKESFPEIDFHSLPVVDLDKFDVTFQPVDTVPSPIPISEPVSADEPSDVTVAEEYQGSAEAAAAASVSKSGTFELKKSVETSDPLVKVMEAAENVEQLVSGATEESVRELLQNLELKGSDVQLPDGVPITDMSTSTDLI